MLWLQWSTIDLQKGVGGVENHARCLARELRKLGVEAVFSQDPKDFLDPKWDVVHTHGTAVLPELLKERKRLARLAGSRGQRVPIHVQAVHGETWGRMRACREWTWVGGYLAHFREKAGVRAADVILADHDNLDLFRFAKAQGKVARVASNGWDSMQSGEKLAPELERALKALGPYWVFLGRGDDPVKGAALVARAFDFGENKNALRLVAVPGGGFQNVSHVFRSGSLSGGQVRTVLEGARGLVLPSLYEGLPLVVLEALSFGKPVVGHEVGGLTSLQSMDLKGLSLFRNPPFASEAPLRLREAVERMEASLDFSEAAQHTRARHNQEKLPKWSTVAERAVAAVNEFRRLCSDS